MFEEKSTRAQKTDKTLVGFEKYLLARRAACAAQLPHPTAVPPGIRAKRSRLVGFENAA